MIRGAVPVVLLAAFAMLSITPGLAYAGLVMTEADGETTLMSEGKMKSTWEGVTIVMDGSKSELTFSSTEAKVFAQGTVDDYCKAMTAIQNAMMEKMPEEYRKMMKQMMDSKKKQALPKVSLVDAGGGGEIAGFKTAKYKVMVDGDLYEEVWLATDPSLAKEYKPLIDMLGKFSGCVGGMSPENAVEAMPEYLELMKKGFLLKSVSHKEGGETTSTDIVKLEKKDIPAAEFQPPSGYRKVPFSEFFRSQMGVE